MTENNINPSLPNLNPLPGTAPLPGREDVPVLPPDRRGAGGVRGIHLIIISALLAAILLVNVIALILQFVTPVSRAGVTGGMPTFSQEEQQQFQNAPSGDFPGGGTTGDNGDILSGAGGV